MAVTLLGTPGSITMSGTMVLLLVVPVTWRRVQVGFALVKLVVRKTPRRGRTEKAAPRKPPWPEPVPTKALSELVVSTAIALIARPVKTSEPGGGAGARGSLPEFELNGPLIVGLKVAFVMTYNPVPKKQPWQRFPSPVPTKTRSRLEGSIVMRPIASGVP